MAIQNDKGAPLPKGTSLQRALECFGCEQLPLGIKNLSPSPPKYSLAYSKDMAKGVDTQGHP